MDSVETKEPLRFFNQPYVCLPRLNTCNIVSIDTETSGLDVWYGEDFTLSGISFYFPEYNESHYLSFNHGGGDNMSQEALGFLVSEWNNLKNNPRVIMFNAKFDRAVMERVGFDMEGLVIEDVILLAQLLNENEDRFALKILAEKYLGSSGAAGERELQAKLKAKGYKKHEMWRLSGQEVAFYAMKDTEITWFLREFYRPYAEKWMVWDLYQERCKFSNEVLYTMERNGLRIDRELNEELNTHALHKADDLEREINELVSSRVGANVEVNPRSPKQLLGAFKMLGLDLDSTDSFTLSGLADNNNELARLVLDYRHYSKASSSFYNSYINYMDRYGYVHPNYWATGTVTGRLSCSNPNLQQVPRSGSYEVKKVFIPSNGYTIVSVDYAQLELRLGVHYSKCETMRDMFLSGDDMHQWTADAISERAGLSLTRHMGKTANFGLIYGMGYKRAARMFGVNQDVSKLIVESWHELYPEFRKANKYAETLASVKRTVDGTMEADEDQERYRYIRLFNGRVRHFDQIPERAYTAFNALIQGTGAVVTEQAIQRVYDYLAGVNKHEFNLNSVRLLATVHDSVIFEIKNSLLPYGKESPIIKKIIEKMQVLPEQTDRFGGLPVDVPLLVDVKMSKESWYHAD